MNIYLTVREMTSHRNMCKRWIFKLLWKHQQLSEGTTKWLLKLFWFQQHKYRSYCSVKMFASITTFLKKQTFLILTGYIFISISKVHPDKWYKCKYFDTYRNRAPMFLRPAWICKGKRADTCTSHFWLPVFWNQTTCLVKS